LSGLQQRSQLSRQFLVGIRRGDDINHTSTGHGSSEIRGAALENTLPLNGSP
jgi:hypothetical protein